MAFFWTLPTRASALRFRSEAFVWSHAKLESLHTLQSCGEAAVPELKDFWRNGGGDVAGDTTVCHLDDFLSVAVKDKTS